MCFHKHFPKNFLNLKKSVPYSSCWAVVIGFHVSPQSTWINKGFIDALATFFQHMVHEGGCQARTIIFHNYYNVDNCCPLPVWNSWDDWFYSADMLDVHACQTWLIFRPALHLCPFLQRIDFPKKPPTHKNRTNTTYICPLSFLCGTIVSIILIGWFTEMVTITKVTLMPKNLLVATLHIAYCGCHITGPHTCKMTKTMRLTILAPENFAEKVRKSQQNINRDICA